MAKRRGRPKQSERDDVSVKIDRTLVGKARLVATHQGISMAELLSDIIKGPLDRHYAQMVRELGEADAVHKAKAVRGKSREPRT